MPRAKSKFNRPQDSVVGGPLLDEELRAKLLRLHPAQGDDSQCDPVFGHPAEDFVNYVLDVAQWFWSQIEWNKECVRTDEVTAELKTLRTQLRKVLAFIQKYPRKALKDTTVSDLASLLRKASRDVESALGIEADLLGCADAIDVMRARDASQIECAASVSALLDQVSAAQVDGVKRLNSRAPTPVLATEFALRIIRVFEEHGVTVSSSATGAGNNTGNSALIESLCLISASVGVPMEAITWSKYVGAAYKQGARLTPKPPPKTSAKACSTIDVYISS